MTISRSESDPMIIRIVAAAVVDAHGQTLLVRKRGTAAFMQPGGKLAENETPLAALGREIEEELGCRLEPETYRPIGTFAAQAANEAGFTVEAQLFEAMLAGDAKARGEIEEVVWIDPDDAARLPLAPLTENYAMPVARDWKLRLRNAMQ